MSDTPAPRNPETSETPEGVIDPAPPAVIKTVGIYFFALSILLLYLLITTWPVPEYAGTAFRPVNIFGFSHHWAPERHLMFTVMIAGAMGSLAHSLTSFADYVGNRKLSLSWIWFLILRVPVGIAIALLFYFVVRGGILIPTVQIQPQNALPLDTTMKINPFAIAGFAALAGMFSKQATDKLAAVFDVVFAMKDPVDRKAPLGSEQSITISPSRLTRGKREDLTITGSGFTPDTKAKVNGKDRPFKHLGATKGTVTILDEDVKDVGKLDLVITNPNKDTFNATIEIVDLDAKPVISETDPKALTKASTSLTIIGQGFHSGCTTTVNGKDRKPSSVADKKITIPLETADLASSSELKFVVKNPNGDSAEVTVRIV